MPCLLHEGIQPIFDGGAQPRMQYGTTSIYSSLIKFLFCTALKEHYKQNNSHGFNQIEA